MDQGLKERLVGAAVLVAIAVWLIPWVLDGPEGELEPSTSSLRLPAAEEPMPMRTQTLRLGGPPESSNEAAPAAASPAPETAAAAEPSRETKPEVQETTVAEAPAPEPTVAAARPEPERQTPVRSATPPKASAPAPTTATAAGDWTVQLGSFSDEANARRLAQRAGTFGYKAAVTSHRSDGRTLYRVRVGPQPTRAAADAAASALRAHGMDARVVDAR
jgi:DedD protein